VWGSGVSLAAFPGPALFAIITLHPPYGIGGCTGRACWQARPFSWGSSCGGFLDAVRPFLRLILRFALGGSRAPCEDT
jgi:hypothetical protein